MDKKLILFTRFPEAGKCKTRLIPALGAEGAAELQRRLGAEMATRMLNFAKTSKVVLEIRYEGGNQKAMTDWLGKAIPCLPQGGGDLGERLARTFTQAFAEGFEAVVVMGADCPGLDREIMTRAFAALERAELVLGPASDGGYYLVGLSRPAPPLFSGIPWGGAQVLTTTLDRAKNLQLTHLLLKTLSDIDRPEDLRHLEEPFRRDTLPYAYSISVIIPVINEEAFIGQTLCSIAGQPGLEVIVSDGGSKDQTPALALAAGARLVSSPPGRGVQQNAGARAARGRVLLFLHADTRLPAGFAGQILEALERPGVVAGAFLFAVDDRQWPFRLLEILVNLRTRYLRLPYGDQALFMTAGQFAASGGFAEIPFLEDLELVLRLRKRGKIILLKSAVQTSARRWQRLGFLRTTLINQLILLGFFCGFSPNRLAPWYALLRRDKGGATGKQTLTQGGVGDQGEKKI